MFHHWHITWSVSTTGASSIWGGCLVGADCVWCRERQRKGNKREPSVWKWSKPENWKTKVHDKTEAGMNARGERRNFNPEHTLPHPHTTRISVSSDVRSTIPFWHFFWRQIKTRLSSMFKLSTWSYYNSHLLTCCSRQAVWAIADKDQLCTLKETF